jgi:hypothetical protein
MNDRDLSDLTNTLNSLNAIETQVNLLSSLVRRMIESNIATPDTRSIPTVRPMLVASEDGGMTSRRRAPRRILDDDSKRNVVERARQIGYAEAARQFGVSMTSVKRWSGALSARHPIHQQQGEPRRAVVHKKSAAKKAVATKKSAANAGKAQKMTQALKRRWREFHRLGGTGQYTVDKMNALRAAAGVA